MLPTMGEQCVVQNHCRVRTKVAPVTLAASLSAACWPGYLGFGFGTEHLWTADGYAERHAGTSASKKTRSSSTATLVPGNPALSWVTVALSPASHWAVVNLARVP